MPGVVACEALYNLVERVDLGGPVRYVPAELHEFPVNVPLTDAIHTRIQAAIDELDTPSRDTIVVSYALGDAATPLSTTHASLVVSPAPDCISTVLPEGTDTFGENKAPGTLYLTRGWIDCGVDSYKLYRAYREDLDGLLEAFATATARHADLRYTWHQGERFERALDRSAPASADLADDFFRSVVEHYDRVVLVDTGDLYEFHHDYAEQCRRFVERLKQDSDRGGDVSLAVVDGETEPFRALLEGTTTAD